MSRYTYERLRTASLDGKAVFRIWVDVGESPLKSDLNPCHSGFFSPNPFSLGLDQAAFEKKCDSHLLEPADEESWIRESILDHVRGDAKWLGTASRRGPHIKAAVDSDPMPQAFPRATTTAADKARSDLERSCDTPPPSPDHTPVKSAIYNSPWIVTYSNLDYTIHRIARLISRDPGARIHMSVIQPNTDSGKVFEIFTRSLPHLELLKTLAPWGSSERKLLNEACGFSDRSGEVLFYGRIFGDSVKEDFLWTYESKPFSLPGCFSRTRLITRPTFSPSWTWMNILFWQPAVTPYTSVRTVLEAKRQAPEEDAESLVKEWREEVALS